MYSNVVHLGVECRHNEKHEEHNGYEFGKFQKAFILGKFLTITETYINPCNKTKKQGENHVLATTANLCNLIIGRFCHSWVVS